MADCVELLTDRVELSFVKDGSVKAVSLTGLVRPDAKLAMLQVVNEGGTDQLITAHGGSPVLQSWVRANDDVFTLIECDNPTQTIYLAAPNGDLRFYALGSFYGDGVVAWSTAQPRPIQAYGEISTWKTYSVTNPGGAYDAEQMEATLLLFRQIDGTYTTTWGARAFGSTVDKTFLDSQVRPNFAWLPCRSVWDGMSQSLYQLYLSAKDLGGGIYTETGTFYELGFVYHGFNFNAIFETTDEDPPAVTDWTLRAASAQVPGIADGVLGISYSHPLTNFTHGVRSPGSTDAVTTRAASGDFVRGCHRAELDDQNRYEYWLRGNPELWIFGYRTEEEVQLEGVDAIAVEAESDQDLRAVGAEATQNVAAIGAEPSQDALAFGSEDEQDVLAFGSEDEQDALAFGSEDEQDALAAGAEERRAITSIGSEGARDVRAVAAEEAQDARAIESEEERVVTAVDSETTQVATAVAVEGED